MENWKKRIKRNIVIYQTNKYRIFLREAKFARRNKRVQLKNKRKLGEKNPEKIIYLIHRDNEKTGLFSDVITFLGRVKEAVDNGWVPVIDMKNYPSMYKDCLTDNPETNVWELFFEQPKNTTVEEALVSQNVIEVEASGAVDYPFASKAFLEDEYGKLKKWRGFMHKYIRIKESIRYRIEQEYHNMISDEEKVLGVLVRGSDYTKLKPVGHPIQPTVNQVIEKINEVVEEQGYDKIYLSTEERDTVEKIKEVFGDRVVYLDRDYIEYSEGYLSDLPLTSEQKINNGIDYLVQIALLAKCNGIIAGICSGTVGAALLSEGFEYEYYWDLGYYEGAYIK